MNSVYRVRLNIKNYDTEKTRKTLQKLSECEEIESSNTTTFIFDGVNNIFNDIIVPLIREDIIFLGMYDNEDITHNRMVACADRGVVCISKDLSGNVLSPTYVTEKYDEVADKVKTYFKSEIVHCKFCDNEVPVGITHIHQDKYVCNDCWDDRLLITA